MFVSYVPNVNQQT